MVTFNLGDFVKITAENRVFKVCGFTGTGSRVIPSGWLIDQGGFAINPKVCEPYKGGASCINLK